MTGLAVLGAQYKLRAHDREELQLVHFPWALRAGTRCQDLTSIYYEKHLEVCGSWGGCCAGCHLWCNPAIVLVWLAAGGPRRAEEKVEDHPRAYPSTPPPAQIPLIEVTHCLP